MGSPQFIIQNDSLNTPVVTPIKNKVLYRSESQKQRTNAIKTCRIMTNGNRYLLNLYTAELSAILLS